MAVARASRRVYIDWARGIAVLLMIGAHVTDAWTRPASRPSTVFRDVVVLGGFAAPLFLLLAGLSSVLAATRTASRPDRGRRDAVKAICQRGLEIFLLAFLFRLQAFIVTPGSYLVSLFHVDILNIMGPAIVGAGLLWAMSRTTAGAVTLFSVAATAVTLATPIVRESAVVDGFPVWVQWYLRPSGDHTTFNLFPWAGFVFVGGACGVLVASAKSDADERRLQVAFAGAGLLMVVLGFVAAGRPSPYRVSSFWTSSPAWFLIRAGALTLALPLFYSGAWLARLRMAGPSPVEGGPGADWLARLGRHSLFVYWIHVELVYGYLTWPIHHKLPLWGTALGFVVFSSLMYRAIDLRDRALATWRDRFRRHFASETPYLGAG